MLEKDIIERYSQDQIQHYTQRLSEFGSSSQADSWTSQYLARYYYREAIRNLKDLTDLNIFNPERKIRLLDIGSGNGFYLNYLKETGLAASVDYTGLEINPETCLAAQKQQSDAKFINGDFSTMNFPFRAFDFISIIGTYSIFDALNDLETETYIVNNLRKAFNCVDYGVNLMISRFVVPETTLAKILKISENYELKNNLFGNYMSIFLYRQKYINDTYSAVTQLSS